MRSTILGIVASLMVLSGAVDAGTEPAPPFVSERDLCVHEFSGPIGTEIFATFLLLQQLIEVQREAKLPPFHHVHPPWDVYTSIGPGYQALTHDTENPLDAARLDPTTFRCFRLPSARRLWTGALISASLSAQAVLRSHPNQPKYESWKESLKNLTDACNDAVVAVYPRYDPPLVRDSAHLIALNNPLASWLTATPEGGDGTIAPALVARVGELRSDRKIWSLPPTYWTRAELSQPSRAHGWSRYHILEQYARLNDTVRRRCEPWIEQHLRQGGGTSSIKGPLKTRLLPLSLDEMKYALPVYQSVIGQRGFEQLLHICVIPLTRPRFHLLGVFVVAHDPRWVSLNELRSITLVNATNSSALGGTTLFDGQWQTFLAGVLYHRAVTLGDLGWVVPYERDIGASIYIDVARGDVIISDLWRARKARDIHAACVASGTCVDIPEPRYGNIQMNEWMAWAHEFWAQQFGFGIRQVAQENESLSFLFQRDPPAPPPPSATTSGTTTSSTTSASK